MSDNILNPFKSGDRVVCLVSSWNTIFSGDPKRNSFPKKGDVLIVDDTRDNLVSFANHNIKGCINWFTHYSFAPVQDATDMEFDDAETADETEVAHVEEMTV
jgi:hypothetical protein